MKNKKLSAAAFHKIASMDVSNVVNIPAPSDPCKFSELKVGSAVIAAVDIGGTKVAAGLVTRDGDVLIQVQVPNPGNATDLLNLVAALVEQLHAILTKFAPQSTLASVGVVSGGAIKDGVVQSATDHIHGWADVDIPAEISLRTDLLVAASGDVHGHALGEFLHGAGQGTESLLLAAVGTGIGASHLVNGNPLTGHHGVGGHLGHITVAEAHGVQCSCGIDGHVEAIAAGPAISAHYERLTGEWLPLPIIVARADQDSKDDFDSYAAHVIHTSAVAFGRILGGVTNLLDPEIVIISGGVINAGSRWWDPMLAAATNELLPANRHTRIVPAELGPNAALIGAASLASVMVPVKPVAPAYSKHTNENHQLTIKLPEKES